MRNLLQELNRRKVFRVAAAYVVLAWLLIQVVATILPTFEAPQWVAQSIILLLVMGFPIALIMAWAYELTPNGISEDTGAASASNQNIESTNIVSNAPSIAVLPFRARESDEIEQLTAEGLTDDITTLLTLVKGVKVAPRQAVVRKLAPDDDALQIARELGVRYAVTGSVRRSGEKLRVSTALTDIHNNEQKWSLKFDRPTTDIFAIQDEIAKGIVGTLGGVISRVEGARALHQPPDNLQAWELTLRSISVAFDWRPETLQQGMLDARKAIELDPNYALAHSVLAMILSWRSVSGWTDDYRAERAESVREADKAAKLGYDNADALWMAIDAYWASSPKRSVELYEMSIARQPDIFLAAPFALAHAGVAYARIGREEEGISLIKQFQNTFPNDEFGAVWTRVFFGYAELCRRNYALTADLLANTASEHDGMCRVIALMNSDQKEEAIAEYNRWKDTNPAIKLDHYTEYFKGYHVDKSIGAELSHALTRLKQALT
ncbi:MAG: adenylate cyclase [Cryomorphaceae bacterium]|jgi:adenylate cyclase